MASLIIVFISKMAALCCRVSRCLQLTQKGNVQLGWSRASSQRDKGKETTVEVVTKISTGAAPITTDGIYKKHGTLSSFFRTIDGKRIYPGKLKFLKLEHLTEVRIGMVLCQQKVLNFHPGLNVGLGRDLTLYALENGTVYITYEKVNPNWDHYVVKDSYSDQKDMSIFKPHYNVVAVPQTQNFKLVEQL